MPNAANLVKQGNDLRRISADERVALGSLELMREELPPAQLPGLSVINGPAITFADPGQFTASDYFAAKDRYGRPAIAPGRLADATDFQRLAVDRVLLDHGDLGVVPVPGGPSARGPRCKRLGTSAEFKAPAKPLSLVPAGGGAISIAARRFGATFQALSGVPSEGGVRIVAPSTPGGQEWRLKVGPGVIVCPAPGA